MISSIKRGKQISHDKTKLVTSLYRPYFKQWLYNGSDLIHRVGQMPEIFPTTQSKNLAIMVEGSWRGNGQIALMINSIACLLPDGGCQCFPLRLYDTEQNEGNELFSSNDEEPSDGITDFGVDQFRNVYPQENSITKEDLFYYIYGLLHSPEYRTRYKDNLSKELPRIPAVKKFADFQAFSKAGRDLAHWHLDYETVACHDVTLDFTGEPKSLASCQPEHFCVRKMKFPKVTDPETKKRVNDRSVVIFNEYITLRDIPLSAYDYVVNGKSAIEWVMERQAVTTDKKSGIVNDANAWATETMKNPAYPLELLMRIITVSLQTNQIVASLPALDID